MGVVIAVGVPPSRQEGVGALWFWWWDLSWYVHWSGGVPPGVCGGGCVMRWGGGLWWAVVVRAWDGRLHVPWVRVGVIGCWESDPPWRGGHIGLWWRGAVRCRLGCRVEEVVPRRGGRVCRGVSPFSSGCEVPRWSGGRGVLSGHGAAWDRVLARGVVGVAVRRGGFPWLGVLGGVELALLGVLAIVTTVLLLPRSLGWHRMVGHGCVLLGWSAGAVPPHPLHLPRLLVLLLPPRPPGRPLPLCSPPPLCPLSWMPLPVWSSDWVAPPIGRALVPQRALQWPSVPGCGCCSTAPSTLPEPVLPPGGRPLLVACLLCACLGCSLVSCGYIHSALL